MRPYFVRRQFVPRAGNGGLAPDAVAQLYGFTRLPNLPSKLSVPLVALVELGGGYSPAAIQSWCQSHGYPLPNIVSFSVDGATNNYTGDPNSADVEVELDICNVIGVVFAMTGLAANIVVVFAPNSNQGFTGAIKASATQGAAACGISWGGPEDSWGAAAIAAMDDALETGTAKGCVYCCAAGDAGSSDGETGDHADYPGSSRYAVCCGGTSIVVQNGKIVTETPWNRDGGATGGGYSASEPTPSWQVGFVPAGKLRGVPDLAAFADPSPGWDTPFGPIGGTSAVAPMMAAVFAVASVVVPHGDLHGLGLVNPLLYPAEPTAFRDIVTGNNGDMGAGKGWDPASGLGVPVGSPFLAALANQGTTVPPPGPTPPPHAICTLTFPRAVPMGGSVRFRAPVAIPAGSYGLVPGAGSSGPGSWGATAVTDGELTAASLPPWLMPILQVLCTQVAPGTALAALCALLPKSAGSEKPCACQ